MENRKPGLGKRNNIDKNAKVFHVVQRTCLKLNLFESDKVYEYWINHLKFYCVEENITILAAIMMSNHYHVLLHAEGVDNIQRMFKRLNTGFSQFIKTNIIKASKFESYFSSTFPFKLFSSAERLFPVEGLNALLIDTKYLFDNPKHHNCSNIGLRYSHSNFLELNNSKIEKKDLKIYYELYGNLYPSQVVRLISKPHQEFIESCKSLKINMDILTENRLFKKNPQIEWKDSIETISSSYQVFDV